MVPRQRDDGALKGGLPRLALIVSAARSGSTLLRLLLDAHPDVGAPAEAGIPALIGHLAQVWGIVSADHIAQPSLIDLPIEFKREVIAAALAPVHYYCTAERKRVYVDKSLDSFAHLGLVHDFLPQTRYILLFRHVMDTVLSGIEASPWGFQAYGYAPYVHPSNFVAGLVAYWQDHVTAALTWERKHPNRCLRVMYEDLVAKPEETLGRVCDFLEVSRDLSLLEKAFAVASVRKGPGDYKVRDTTEVRVDSVARGRRVPVSLVPPAMLAATNESLETLGYPALTDGWNTQSGLETPRVDAEAEHGALQALLASIDLPKSAEVGRWKLLTDDGSGLEWLIDGPAGEVRMNEGDGERVLIGSSKDLLAVLRGQGNLPAYAVAGRIRQDQTQPRLDPSDLLRVVHLLRLGIARAGQA